MYAPDAAIVYDWQLSTCGTSVSARTVALSHAMFPSADEAKMDCESESEIALEVGRDERGCGGEIVIAQPACESINALRRVPRKHLGCKEQGPCQEIEKASSPEPATLRQSGVRG